MFPRSACDASEDGVVRNRPILQIEPKPLAVSLFYVYSTFHAVCSPLRSFEYLPSLVAS